jgi:hypothetical protein
LFTVGDTFLFTVEDTLGIPSNNYIMNKWIVFIFAGRDSLHQQWKEDHREFGFDLCLLQYDEDCEFTDANSRNAKYLVKRRGLRFKLLSYFMKDHPEVLGAYEHYFMMDDDVETSPSEINKLLKTCKRFHFDLAQPALDHGSYATYDSNRKVDKLLFRLTPTVEIGLPIFSNRAFNMFQEDLHFIPKGVGWGLECVWEMKFHASKGRSVWGGRIGIIDDVKFRHARPLGYEPKTGVYANGGDHLAWDDLLSIRQKYGDRLPVGVNLHTMHSHPIKPPRNNKKNK